MLGEAVPLVAIVSLSVAGIAITAIRAVFNGQRRDLEYRLQSALDELHRREARIVELETLNTQCLQQLDWHMRMLNGPSPVAASTASPTDSSPSPAPST